jgi:hypothetical protein
LIWVSVTPILASVASRIRAICLELRTSGTRVRRASRKTGWPPAVVARIFQLMGEVSEPGPPTREELVGIIRRSLALLREDDPLRHELVGLLAESLATRTETRAFLERLDERFAEQRKTMDERFAEQRKTMDERFAELRKENAERFEKIDERFEKIDERFEKIDERFAEQRKENAERFEAMDRRFEAMQLQMDRRFDEARREREDHVRRMDVIVGGLQRRAGRNLEDLLAGTLRLALGLSEIRPEHVRLRQTVQDTTGKIGPAGRTYEYDILAINGQAVVFEVKSNPKAEDVERFADKADLVAEELARPDLRRVLLTLVRSDEVIETCELRQVELTI